MNEVSKLFDIRSKKYDQIYREPSSKKLLHQEKKVRALVVEELVAGYLSSSEEGVVVDISCGIGNVLLNLRVNGVKAKMYGADISKDMIKLAKKRLASFGYKDITFVAGSSEVIDVVADIVLSLGVIGYQKNQIEFIDSLAKLVNKSGYFIFTTANGDSFLRAIRSYLSKLHSILKKETKSRGVLFSSIKDKQVKRFMKTSGFKLEKRIYLTFGIGLFSSTFECFIDRILFRYFNNSHIGKYLSLSVIHVYKRV